MTVPIRLPLGSSRQIRVGGSLVSGGGCCFEIYLFHFPCWIFCFLSPMPGSGSKESACNAGDPGSIPGSESSPGEGNGYPLRYSDLKNSRDCIVHGVTKGQLNDFHFHAGRQGHGLQPWIPSPGSFLPFCEGLHCMCCSREAHPCPFPRPRGAQWPGEDRRISQKCGGQWSEFAQRVQSKRNPAQPL